MIRRSRGSLTLLAVSFLVVACRAGGPTGSIAPSSVAALATPSASSTPVAAATPTPVCAHRPPPSWVTAASNPKDGVPDPAGRIFFGQVERVDDLLGQIVAPLFAIDADGSDLVQVLDCEMERPRVSPDGSRLAFSIVMSDGTWQVATSAVDGSELRVLTKTAGAAETPDWAPDGASLIYSYSPNRCALPTCVEDGSFHQTLWRMNVDGSDPTLIGDPKTYDWESRLSPDWRRVVIGRIRPDSDRNAIIVRDLATGKERSATPNTTDLEHPDWSPDGRWIVYNTLKSPDGRDLQSIERVSSEDPTAKPVVLAGDFGHAAYKPAYSPDGARIVFGCDGSVCLMDADGSHRETLRGVGGVELNHFAWGVTPKAAP